MTTIPIVWKWYTFKELSSEDLYDILQLRQEVFVVEQNCAYLDCDGLDRLCLHLAGWQISQERKKLIAYLRVLPPQSETSLPAIGRLLTHPEQRARGLGRAIMQSGLQQINRLFPGKPVRISAQQYLVDFYAGLGFRPSSEMYREDGIPHIEMILYASRPLPPDSE